MTAATGDSTSRFFALPQSTTDALRPRRVTRSASARLASGSTSVTAKSASKTSRPPRLSGPSVKAQVDDIEDAVLSQSASKRRRISTKPDTNSPIKYEEPISIKSEAPLILKHEDIGDSPPSRARRPARTITDPLTGISKTEPPSDWKIMYDEVLKMRQPGGAASEAAVDTMGCERLADKDASPRDQRFHTLVALMLSSQTKDTVTSVVMKRLQKELPPYRAGAVPGLNLENMLAVDPDVLNQMIWAVGFHNNKTKYLKKVAVILRDDFKGDIPSTIQGLTSLPGVGPKMAHLCLSVAWNRTEGIGVDVHVHRITNLWGWQSTRTPEETRHSLESWLPRDRWREINWLLVGFGQKVCLPVGRRCGDCRLGMQGLCRAADRKKVNQSRRLAEEGKEEPDNDEVASGVKGEDSETKETLNVKEEDGEDATEKSVAIKKEEDE